MADIGIRRPARRRPRRVGGATRRHRQRHRDTAGFPRQPGHPVGIGAGRRDQQLAAERNEGADRGLGDEVAAALQRQRCVLAANAMCDPQQPLADAGIERAEVIVPRREVVTHGLAHLGSGGDGAGDQKQHVSYLGVEGCQRNIISGPWSCHFLSPTGRDLARAQAAV